MNGQLQKVAEMIKKTFHTKQQNDCFDGSVLYTEEHCTITRALYTKGIETKFVEIQSQLKAIGSDIKDIKKEVGLNGTSEG